MTASFSTACRHQATATPIEPNGDSLSGKWAVQIKGPQVTEKSASATIYSEPSEHTAMVRFACVLNAPLSHVAVHRENQENQSLEVSSEDQKITIGCGKPSRDTAATAKPFPSPNTQ